MSTLSTLFSQQMLGSKQATNSAPINLTGLQQAYWFGEQGVADFYTPAAFHRSYQVANLDRARLMMSLDRLVARNELLRTRFNEEGTQTILPHISVACLDMPAQLGADSVAWLLDQLPDLAVGGAVVCAIESGDEGLERVHFALRLMAMDGKSLALFFDELLEDYHGYPVADKTAGLFGRFVDKLWQAPQTAAFETAKNYWLKRLPTLPGAPQLPIESASGQARRTHFKRLETVLSRSELEALQQAAARSAVSLSAFLCTAYADTLRLWSSSEHFCINLLVSGRPTDWPGIERSLGNFSTTFPLQIEPDPQSFIKRAQAVQVQTLEDLENLAFSGVDIVRAMGGTVSAPPPMPVVFASTLGVIEAQTDLERFKDWQIVEESIHTPQVWLDHQAYFRQGQLVLSWDIASGGLLPGVAEPMFATYLAHLKTLSDPQVDLGSPLRPVLPEALQNTLEAPNLNSVYPLPNKTLHGLFVEACRATPQQPALICHELTLSYEQLLAQAQTIAAHLSQQGVGPNHIVGVMAHKSWQQVVCLMGVLLAGGAYLPISPDLPLARQEHLANRPGVTALLIADDLPRPAVSLSPNRVLAIQASLAHKLPESEQALYIQSPADLAYVIFTSGSTGDPKGVAITHKGAVNTILDINRRFAVQPSDRLLVLSAFNFDLSVFDIFGSLAAGATMVIPPHSATPDPEQWAACVQQHGVSVWNSVPAYLDMLLEFLPSERAQAVLASLRLVMLSGDWIPLDLPRRLKQQAPQAQLIALGGATEASIWSNYFEVEQVQEGWNSIPYGWPLSNQHMWVLDKNLDLCPPFVAGEIYIGGVGLARGYYLDYKKTRAHFLVCPRTGQRLYRTGDMGRYDQQGCIEFLGRQDSQVKIRGFRIELGEIEAVLERCPSIHRAAVIVREAGTPQARLVAAYATHPDHVLDAAQLGQFCAEHLAPYMVPSWFVALDDIPITANGKLDRKSLQTLINAQVEPTLADVADLALSPTSATEARLHEIWRSVLKRPISSVHSTFFDLGGTSLTAVRLLNRLKQEFGLNIPLASLFTHDSIASQAAYLDVYSVDTHAQTQTQRSPRVLIRSGQPQTYGLTVWIHPVGGNVLCYQQLFAQFPAGVRLIALQSFGNGAERSVPAMVKAYIDALEDDIQAAASIQLAGWSMGGMLAHEMAVQLEARGKSVQQVVLIDSWASSQPANEVLDDELLRRGFEVDLARSRALSSVEPEVHEWSDLDEELFGEYKQNYLALIHHQPGQTRAPLVHYRATILSQFPGLEPFNRPHQQQTEMLLPYDHFSIMSVEVAPLLVSTLLRPALLAESRHNTLAPSSATTACL